MSATKPRQEKPTHKDELLDEALEESFPASDPPSLVGPGGGITGPNDAPPNRSVSGKPETRQRTGEAPRK